MPQTDLAGVVLGGRYRLDCKLGVGGSSEVWQATHLTLGSRVAAKLVASSGEALSEELRARHARAKVRLFAEARAMAQVDSRFVVRVLDAGETSDGEAFLIMELVDGETLGARMERQRQLSPLTTVRLLSQVARGVDRAHAAGIIHRDLKPENILVTLDEHGELLAKVTDFGVAAVLAQASLAATRGELTPPAHGFWGTPVYMAPEQILGAQELVTPAADVWAFGVIAFECLTGRLPFVARDLGHLRAIIQEGKHTPAHTLLATIPMAFETWFERACHQDPMRRFATLRTAASALAEALEVSPETSSQWEVFPSAARSVPSLSSVEDVRRASEDTKRAPSLAPTESASRSKESGSALRKGSPREVLLGMALGMSVVGGGAAVVWRLPQAAWPVSVSAVRPLMRSLLEPSLTASQSIVATTCAVPAHPSSSVMSPAAPAPTLRSALPPGYKDLPLVHRATRPTWSSQLKADPYSTP